MKQVLLYSVVFVLLMGCGSNRNYTEQENQAYQNLQDLIASKSLEIVSNSASPFASAAFSRVANSNILGPGNSANNIDLTTNANRLIIKGDSIQGYLPYFGEQNFGGGYNGNHSGIEFNDVPENYKVVNDNRKHAVDIRFKIDDEHRSNEHYNVMITLYPNNRSTIRIQSTTRSSIEYTGRVSPLEEVKD
ncbi:uncharacterized protein DUF4251 [Gelidibacter algens]|uniref:Uncharacterized protein DUF4251 n=1 Tax=Gelidibacter algens TaxID=49280 RepID=A0A1A7R3T2_9FLAO|nr:DUF4251 domain-containing protein [Gelidibacter algens]OBX26506.1 hypothetical protein A9996_04210 [Gelidibacter algens]RAJ26670.1 uncharacterized protein DUF4251 [Gelidibacter algens]